MIGITNKIQDKILGAGDVLNTKNTDGIMVCRIPYFSSSIAIWVWSNRLNEDCEYIVEVPFLRKDTSAYFYAYKDESNCICIKNNTNSSYRVILCFL